MRYDRDPQAALLLWFKTFYEAVGLPKLNCVATSGDFCEPPRLLLIRAADIDPIANMAIRSDHNGAVFFHRGPHNPRNLPPTCFVPLVDNASPVDGKEAAE
jgi:hypothetical protein